MPGHEEALAASLTSPDALSDPFTAIPGWDLSDGNVTGTEGLDLGDSTRSYGDWLSGDWLYGHDIFRTMFPSA